jgi:flagellar basal-body rod protein FlgB
VDFLSNNSVDVLTKALDGHYMRHQAIASNLANVDTPGYKKQIVSFEGQLQSVLNSIHQRPTALPTNDAPLAMWTTEPGHFSNVPTANSLDEVVPTVSEMGDAHYRNDGNSVDVETEMVDLARNTERYLALSNIENRMMRSMKAAITNSNG